jgi:hypothetical protein
MIAMEILEADGICNAKLMVRNAVRNADPGSFDMFIAIPHIQHATSAE